MFEYLGKNKSSFSDKQILERSKKTLLCLLVLSFVNSLFLVNGSTSYFISSLSVPYYILCVGCALGGKLPREFYVGLTVPQENGIFVVSLVISFLILAVYVTSVFLSNKYIGLFCLPIAMFAADSLFLLAVSLICGFNSIKIVDVIVHAWVGFDLVKASFALKRVIKADKKLKQNNLYLKFE